MLIQLAVRTTHLEIGSTVENAVAHSWTNPIDELDVLQVVGNDSLTRREPISRADQPVNDLAKGQTNVLIRPFDIIKSRR